MNFIQINSFPFTCACTNVYQEHNDTSFTETLATFYFVCKATWVVQQNQVFYRISKSNKFMYSIKLTNLESHHVQ